MNFYLKALVASFCLLYISTSLSAQIKHSSDVENPVREVMDQGLNAVQVSYQLKGLQSFSVEREKQTYTFHSIPQFNHLAEAGKPALPAHIDYIAIPEGASFTLDIQSIQSTSHQTATVHPALKPARDTEGAPEPAFELDEETYRTNAFYPSQPVEIVDIIELRGLRLAMVSVQPVQYNPVTGELKVHEQLQYTIRFKGGQHFLNPEEHSKHYLDMLVRYPLNSASLSKEITASKSINQQSTTPNYLILTHDNYQDAADSLAKWKTQMGYNVEIISSNSWTTSDVTFAVHSRYQNYAPKPDYFVIIGDHGDIPAEIKVNSDGENFGTDLYYACMDGSSDHTADIARGRISVSSSAEAVNVVQKIIQYEKHPVQDSSFYQNGINCAQFQDDDNDGYADRRFTHTSEDVRNYMMSQGYSVRRIYYTDNSVYPGFFNQGYYSNGQAIPTELDKMNGFAWDGNNTQIKNAVDSGRFYLLHRDHGYAGGSGWAHPYFVKTNVNQLANGNKLPVVFSINCHTGEFTLPNCFAETFLRKQNGGAVGVFGASYYSYSGYNDGLTIGLFDGIWSNPGLVPNFGYGGISSPTVTTHADIVTMGDLLNHGLIRMAQTWGGNSSGRIYTNQLFHYFGDPAMRIWTEQPDSLTATYTAQINCTDTALIINGVNKNDVQATLVGNGTLLGKAIISNGSGYIPLNGIQGTTLTLTLTKRNCVPFIATVGVAPGGSLALFQNIQHNSCHGDTIAYIEVIPSCGYPPYSVQWSTGDTTNKIEHLSAGTYMVTVSDQNTTINDTITILQPTSGVSAAATLQDAKCNFESSGSIDLDVIGGTSPYTYAWSNGQSTKDAINLSADTYTVTITDGNNCPYTYSYVINEPPAIDITASSVSDTNAQCVGTAEAIITGGTLPYAISWNDPAAQTQSQITGLCSGLYKVTVTDSNQCSRYRTVYVDNYSNVGIEENNENALIKVFPNPSKGVFTISTEEGFAKGTIIEIYDVQAKRIYLKTIVDKHENVLTIDLQSKAAGLYHLRIFNTQTQEIYHNELIVE